MVMIPDAIIPAKSSLAIPGGLPIRPNQQITLVRYNIRQAAEEDAELLDDILEWQASQDAWGRGGCYDQARSELAARRLV